MGIIKILTILSIMTWVLIDSACANQSINEIDSDIKAYVNKSEITIGEKIKYNIDVDVDKSVQVNFLDNSSNMDGFEIVDFGIEKEKSIGNGRKRHKKWYLLNTYTVGSYIITPQIVQLKSHDGKIIERSSTRVFVEVRSLLKEGDEDIRDIKAPFEITRILPLWLIVLIAIIVSVLIIISIVFVYRRLKRRKSSFDVKKPAHEIALEELERIENFGFVKKGLLKEYYYCVSNCLRKYIEVRFYVRAPEQTTEEFMDEMVKSVYFSDEQRSMLKTYLEHCDLVKYAKLEPRNREAMQLIEMTRDFIRQTIPTNIQQDKR